MAAMELDQCGMSDVSDPNSAANNQPNRRIRMRQSTPSIRQIRVGVGVESNLICLSWLLVARGATHVGGGSDIWA
jgi:hypothetical protein